MADIVEKAQQQQEGQRTFLGVHGQNRLLDTLLCVVLLMSNRRVLLLSISGFVLALGHAIIEGHLPKRRTAFDLECSSR
ncbi:hypothetical protein ACJJU9_17565 [Pseudomonas helleri]|uniref:hypothetical protein n=1 Tax=Pseudomonas helleri TaxID=1608996 RepID=UPI0038998454